MERLSEAINKMVDRGNIPNVKFVGKNLVMNEMNVNFIVLRTSVGNWIASKSNDTKIITPDNGSDNK